MPAFRYPLRVRYAECDPQGIVFNGNYLHYFDIAVTELYREAMGGWSEIQAHGVDAVVAEANVRYLKPLRFDDQVELVAEVERFGDSSMVLAMAIERGGEACAGGTLRYVFIGAKEGAGKASIPAPVREALEHYAV